MLQLGNAQPIKYTLLTFNSSVCTCLTAVLCTQSQHGCRLNGIIDYIAVCYRWRHYLWEAPVVLLFWPRASVQLGSSSSSLPAWFDSQVWDVGVLQWVDVAGRWDLGGKAWVRLPVSVQRAGAVEGGGKPWSNSGGVGACERRNGGRWNSDRVPVKVAAVECWWWWGAWKGVRGWDSLSPSSVLGAGVWWSVTVAVWVARWRGGRLNLLSSGWLRALLLLLLSSLCLYVFHTPPSLLFLSPVDACIIFTFRFMWWSISAINSVASLTIGPMQR